MASYQLDQDTIAAVATAPGRGGIGVIRVSGNKTCEIATKITRQTLTPRLATLCDFKNSNNEVLDNGIALYFSAPNSFTGEDVVELQGHGGPVILDSLLAEIIKLGARLAKPGEFSERAFLNNKLDLTQAEAIADLIESGTDAAARSAVHSLQGAFSKEVNELIEQLIALRIYVEASIDFPEEEIDFLSDGKVATQLNAIIERLQQVFEAARQGALLREGMTVVIAGKPNAGKSSLLNALAGKDSAIVTNIEGTTRDVLREHIQIDGMPLHIIDTAGLRQSGDAIEREGMRRAYQEIEKADHVLLVVDSSKNHTNQTDELLNELWPDDLPALPETMPVTVIFNKADLSGLSCEQNKHGINLSAKTGEGLEQLKQHLKQTMGFNNQTGSSRFSARRRHLNALQKAAELLDSGKQQLTHASAGELLAEDLRQTQQVLEAITGRFTPDDLLDRVFRDFCIGK